MYGFPESDFFDDLLDSRKFTSDYATEYYGRIMVSASVRPLPKPVVSCPLFC